MSKSELIHQNNDFNSSQWNWNHLSLALLWKKEQAIVSLLDNPCPNCWRAGYEWHCTSCWYFPEGNEWDGTNKEALEQEKLNHRPRSKWFNPHHPISEQNQFVKHYPGNIRCWLFSLVRRKNGNSIASFSVTTWDKKYYFYVIMDTDMRIIGFSKNKHSEDRILDAKWAPIRWARYFQKSIKEAWVIEKFVGKVKELPQIKPAH